MAPSGQGASVFCLTDRTNQSGDPLCDISSGCCFLTGLWTITRSSLRAPHRVTVFWRFSGCWCPLCRVPASVDSLACVLVVRWAIHVCHCNRLRFPYRVLDGHPFFLSRAASGAASVLTGPSSWCSGVAPFGATILWF